MKRKISAILAADIVKYSRLVADAEEETVRRLATYRTMFADVTSRHGGRIVNMVGDAVLAEFPSSVDAVRCAIECQETAGSHNRAYPDDRRMDIRIGVTLADIMDQDGELFGDGVNIAARLESLAPPGGICVSQTVREQVGGKIAVAFRDIGQQRVKNLPSPIRAFVIRPDSADGRNASRIYLATPKSRIFAAAATLLVISAASTVAVVRYRERDEAPRSIGPASLAQHAAVPQPAAIRFDEAKVRALAAKQEIPLPRNLTVAAPAATVPARLTGYLGAWGGDRRWNNKGRQAILVVESVNDAGAALGVYAQGLPLAPNAANQNSAQFFPFSGNVSENGLRFPWGPSNYLFVLRPDGSMVGQLDSTNEKGHFDLSIVLDRLE